MKSNIKHDEEWQVLFKKAIVSMCKSGLPFKEEIRIEGVLAVTLDQKDVIVVSVSETSHGSNASRNLPTIADDLERKKMIAPMLSRLFGDEAGMGAQSQVLVSGLKPGRETIGRLVIQSDADNDKPQAKLVLCTSSLSTSASEMPKKAPPSQVTTQGVTPAQPQKESAAGGVVDASLSPRAAAQSTSSQASQSSKKPVDLTMKKSLDSVIAKLHQTTSPPQAGAETGREEPSKVTPMSTQVPPVARAAPVLVAQPNISAVKVDKRKRGSQGVNGETIKGDLISVDSGESDTGSGPSSNKRPRTADSQHRSAFTALKRFTSRKTLDEMEVTEIDKADPSVLKPRPHIPTPKARALLQGGMKIGAKQPELVARQSPRARLVGDKAGTRTPGEKAMHAEVSRRRSSADSASVRSESPSQGKAAEQAKLQATVKRMVTRGFGIGMKLEAEDKGNSLVCCATVADTRGGKVRVHFDGWEDSYDFWCFPWSKLIHPVGWCQEMEVPLSPPKDWENVESFTWEEYLEKTNSLAVPERVFKFAVAEHKRSLKEKLATKTESENSEDKGLKRKRVLGSKLAANKRKAVQKTGGRVVKRGGIAKTGGRGRPGQQGKNDADPSKRRFKKCGNCEPCQLQEDCGNCVFCLDKPKYGGHFTRRQKCIKRRCELYKVEAKNVAT